MSYLGRIFLKFFFILENFIQVYIEIWSYVPPSSSSNYLPVLINISLSQVNVAFF